MLETLVSLKVWCAPVNDYDDVINDPQIKHNRNFISATSAKGTPMTLVNHPIRYDGTVAKTIQVLLASESELVIHLTK